jgi:hypothetical protein
MKIFIHFFLFFFSVLSLAQDTIRTFPIDSLFREDQFYLGISYGTFHNAPSDIKQKSFSANISAGFLRDLPINQTRTLAVAPGFGFSVQDYNQNLLINHTSTEDFQYSIIPSEVRFKRNKFTNVFLEMPFEFRWRNALPESHKFWRVYTGFKLSYMIFNNSRFIANENTIRINNNPDFNKLQYGVYLAAGYNTWNFYCYYGLNPIFNEQVEFQGSTLQLTRLNLGLQFYIL